MESEWTAVVLRDLLETIIDYRGKTPPKSVSGITVLTAASVKNGNVLKDKVSYISEETYQKVTTRGFPKEGDVLITTEAPCGEVAPFPIDKKYHITRRIMALRGDASKIDSDFLLYTLMSNVCQNQIYARVRGTTVSRVLKTDITGLEFKVPPLKTQKKIGAFIRSIDNKIAINQQTNQTLEQMAQALFKSWFVDFDPVIDNALAAGNPIPDELQARTELRQRAIAERTTNSKLKPLPDNIQQLFPSEFEESDLGWIPKGWFSGALASLARYSTSRMDGSELTLENYISTENMLTNKQGVTKASSIPSLKSAPSFITGQVLISNIRPYFKKIWLASSNGGRSNDVLGFESLESKTEAYLMNLLYQDQFFDFMMTTSKGSKMPRGDKKAIMDWGVVVPPVKIRKFYSNLVEGFYSANSIRTKKNDSLVQLRDTLLPKLISGEVILESQIHHEEGV